MVRVEHEHRFGVSPEAGFAFITDTSNWPRYWPGFVSMRPGSRWQAPGDETRIVSKLLGREVELRMTLTRFELNRLVGYESTQDGLPDARHERHFMPPPRASRTGWSSSMSREADFEASTTDCSSAEGSSVLSDRP